MFVRRVYLYCDGGTPDCQCKMGEASWGDGNFETIKDYREMAQMDGWLFRSNNKAYCPECRKKI